MVRQSRVFISNRWLHVAYHGDVWWWLRLQRPTPNAPLDFVIFGLEIAFPQTMRWSARQEKE